MNYDNALWGTLFVEELIRHGIDTFFLSPGSRCTPLTVAIAKHPEARSFVGYDERATSFAALGYARATGKPGVFVCTSGTAVANAMPAVIEASVDYVPLLICSADRPPELLELGSNQTIRQHHLFGDYVRWFFQIPCPSPAISPKWLLSTIDQALHQCRRNPIGPVHLNWAFREPLHPTIPVDLQAFPELHSWRGNTQPLTQYTPPTTLPPENTILEVAQRLQSAQRGLLVIGRLPAHQNKQPIRELMHHLCWPTLTDILSGVHLETPVPWHISHGEAILAHALDGPWDDIWEPDVVLHIGGPLVSKRYPQYLQQCRPIDFIHVQEHPHRQDPALAISMRLESTIPTFCQALQNQLSSRPQGDNPWRQVWQMHQHTLTRTIQTQAKETQHLQEPLIARAISETIPAGHALFVANSMPIRDLERYATQRNHTTPIAANRGASGIDGTLATAAGFSIGNNAPVTLLCGDLTFLHDLNTLVFIQQHKIPLNIVLINNQGGGIFHFLPIASHKDVFEPYFGTPHEYALAPVAQSLGWNVAQPQNAAAFRKVYQESCQQPGPSLIEVRTNREENYEFQQNLARLFQQQLRSPVNSTSLSIPPNPNLEVS